MARARTLKPGFFANERLAECEPLARILYQGLWCHADREGRLEDRPKRLKAEILPYDECDLGLLFEQLETQGFIVRYRIEENNYIQVVNFTKHQNPHPKETASSIPEISGRENKRQDTELPERAGPSPLPSVSPLPIPISVLRTAPRGAHEKPEPLKPLDLDKAYWETGKAFLIANSVPPERAGGLLGRWRKNHGREAVVAALARAEAESASEVVSFVEGCLRSSGNGKRDGPATGIAAGFAAALAERRG